MKIRDLGKAILDFELSTIPKVISIGASLFLALLFGVFHWVVNVYKSLWWVILIGCFIMFFVGLEKDCTGYCWGLIDLHYQGYSIEEEYFYSIIALIVGIAVSFKLDKKLTEISSKFSD